mgnify:FL=1
MSLTLFVEQWMYFIRKFSPFTTVSGEKIGSFLILGQLKGKKHGFDSLVAVNWKWYDR